MGKEGKIGILQLGVLEVDFQGDAEEIIERQTLL